VIFSLPFKIKLPFILPFGKWILLAFLLEGDSVFIAWHGMDGAKAAFIRSHYRFLLKK
jgi:hypothetical protein